MHVLTIAAIFGRVIAEQAKVNKIGRVRQEFEGCEVAFVQRGGVRPHPAGAMFFEQANDLRTMPAGMSKLDGESKVARQLFEKSAQGLLAIFWREGGWQLNKDHLKLWPKRLHGA